MKFVFPNQNYEEKAKDFIGEFDRYGSEIAGGAGLDKYLKSATYQEWIDKVTAGIDIANVKEGKVPAFTYFYVREEDDKIIGMITIRLALNDFLRKEGGHIGYCIRPTERRKHYGSTMLKEALKFCNVIGLNEVIITCNKSNPASAGVIKNCGGQLDAEFYNETFGKTVQRYLIKN